MCGEVIDGMGLPFRGPFPEGDSTGAAFPDGRFAAAHSGVEDVEAFGLAVVVDEEKDGVFL